MEDAKVDCTQFFSVFLSRPCCENSHLISIIYVNLCLYDATCGCESVKNILNLTAYFQNKRGFNHDCLNYTITKSSHFKHFVFIFFIYLFSQSF